VALMFRCSLLMVLLLSQAGWAAENPPATEVLSPSEVAVPEQSWSLPPEARVLLQGLSYPVGLGYWFSGDTARGTAYAAGQLGLLAAGMLASPYAPTADLPLIFGQIGLWRWGLSMAELAQLDPSISLPLTHRPLLTQPWLFNSGLPALVGGGYRWDATPLPEGDWQRLYLALQLQVAMPINGAAIVAGSGLGAGWRWGDEALSLRAGLHWGVWQRWNLAPDLARRTWQGPVGEVLLDWRLGAGLFLGLGLQTGPLFGPGEPMDGMDTVETVLWLVQPMLSLQGHY
jgi:hypothetical protein